MATASVIERRNRQIQDAIEGKNWKQALQLCERRISRGEDTLFLKASYSAWKALILCHYDDEAHHKRGVTETLALCKLDPPVVEVEVINLLQTSLDNIPDQKQLSQSLWEKAAKRKPQDEKLQRRWYSFATGRNDWKSAQKAAMSLQVNYPKDRKYYFQAIFMAYLISQDDQSTEAERKLFGTLSYRMISKAASMVPTDPKELLSPPRAVQNAEELYLLLEIYGSQNYDREALAILDSASLGPKSRIAQNEGTVLLSKISFLRRAEAWEEALLYCRELLGIPSAVNGEGPKVAEGQKATQDSDRTDEWDVWNLLLDSTEKVGTDEVRKSTKEFLQSHINGQKPTRNARLAYLELTDSGTKAGRESNDALFKACKSFLLDYQNKVYCFSDLRPFVHRLAGKQQKEFLPSLSEIDGEIQSQTKKLGALVLQNGEKGPSSEPNSKLFAPEKGTLNEKSKDLDITTKQNEAFGVSKINELKFAYCFSIPSDKTREAKDLLEDFVGKCLSVYDQFLGSKKQDASDVDKGTPIEAADDACLLAAMTLVRLDEVHKSLAEEKAMLGPYLLQAACLLDVLLSKSPSNYQAQLLLTRIQLILGAGSLAMKTFSRLKVKHVQTDITLHHLLTRISTIHPHAAPYEQGSRTDAKDRDPLEALKEALSIYRLSKAASLYGKNAGLDNGSYINVKGSIKLSRDLQFSLCRTMFALEIRRIQRLLHPSEEDYFDVITETTGGPHVDNRDFQGFLDCEPPESLTFEERVRTGPKPQSHWISAMIITDRLFNLLHACTSKSPPFTTLTPIPTLDKDLPEAAEMTTAEISNWKIHIKLTKLLYHLIEESTPAECLTASTAAVEEWLHKTVAYQGDKATFDLHASAYSKNIIIPNWSFLHWSFTTLDTLKAVTLLLDLDSKGAKSKAKKSATSRIPREKINEIRALVTQIFDTIRDGAKRLKDALSSGILEEFLDLMLERPEDLSLEQGALGTKLERVLAHVDGESFLENFCWQMRNAWDEALDGVLMVKL